MRNYHVKRHRTTILEEMLSELGERDKLAYFYCSFSDSESLDPINILGSILAQLCSPEECIRGTVGELYEKNTKAFGKPQRLGSEKLVELILQQINDDHRTLIFLDAINECGSSHAILSNIESLLTRSGARIHICLSSINERDIEDHLQKLPNLYVKNLEQQEMTIDINILVCDYLENHSRLKQHSRKLKDEIISALTQGAQGMYADFDMIFYFG